jgi:hypothetical protein
LVSDGRRLKKGSAHVHAETTDDAIRPVFTRFPAVENHSIVFLVPSHFVSVLTNIVTVRDMIRPVPRRITYPIPSERLITDKCWELCYLKMLMRKGW